MNFVIFDPRPGSAAQAANEKFFENPNGVLGIEVTVPALAARCTLGNIDPQHSGGDASRAAIEDAAFGTIAPPDGATLATVRPDLDSIGSMAVFAIRAAGIPGAPRCDSPICRGRILGSTEGPENVCGVCGWANTVGWTEEVDRRIRLVAESDKFARGGWPGPRPLPTRENPWPAEAATAESLRPLAAIAAAVADFKVPVADRVAMMERWLLKGEEPGRLVSAVTGFTDGQSLAAEGVVPFYRYSVERERQEMIAALEAEGEGPFIILGAWRRDVASRGAEFNRVVWVRTSMGPGKYASFYQKNGADIAVVETTTRAAATSLGYALAPVVIALNPAFKEGRGEPCHKFTICQFTGGYVDLKSVLAELAALEPGWGGSPTIGGSPQGVSSRLTVDQVIGVVAKHLRHEHYFVTEPDRPDHGVCRICGLPA